MTIRTRFAPSPTGTLHLGSIRTALFCWLYARRHSGQFVLRIEDTDRERSTEENVNAILEGLEWLGLDPDEGPVFQTHRMDLYKKTIADWLDSGKAYHCYCSKEELDALRERQKAAGEHVRYDGRCRDRSEPRPGVEPVVRFRNPVDGTVVVDDLVRGRVVFENAQLDDLVIARPDGTPTYNFSVVVDDADMRISHVIRGDDHLNNTPRQINMFAALGADVPAFAHLPMILGPDGAKLSKRHGAVDIRDYRADGYLPSAMLNYLVRLGWSHGDQEIFSVAEMTRLFDLDDVNQSASAFDPGKLKWVNQQHIIAAPADELAALLAEQFALLDIDTEGGPQLADVADGFRERAETIRDMAESARFCFQDIDELPPNLVKKHLRPVVLDPLTSAREKMEALRDWNRESLDGVIKATAEAFDIGLGKLGQPLRVAVTGGPVSPPIDVTLALVGRERTLQRLDRAIAIIAERAGQGG